MAVADEVGFAVKQIAYFNNGSRNNLEENLTKYVSNLTEGEVKRVWAMTVGLKKNDAILCCEEKWGNEKTLTEIDTRGMSDGTLRFLGILTALLTRPEGSLIVIEEVDNGLHPSRAKLLPKALKEIGAMRKIDILITTHNPALMDELGVEMIPFIQVVYRDPEDGTSKITLLEDIKSLPKLLAHGSVGELSTKGELDKSLSRSGLITDALRLAQTRLKFSNLLYHYKKNFNVVKRNNCTVYIPNLHRTIKFPTMFMTID